MTTQSAKERVSATYFLVWHCGMSIPDANAALLADKSTIRPLARAGSYEGKRCFDALEQWVDKCAAARKKGKKK